MPLTTTPPLPAMAPENSRVPEVASVKVFAPRFTVPPVPASPPTACADVAEISNVPSVASVTCDWAASEVPAPSASVPASMVVPPV